MGVFRDDALKQAGYSEGDILPLGAATAQSTNNIQTSSTTFGNSADFFAQVLPPAEELAGSQALAFAISGSVAPGSGETFSIRIKDITNNNVVLGPVGFTSSGFQFLGWGTYNPPDRTVPLQYNVDVKTEPASNSSVLFRSVIHWGVEL